jgi:hypothetical protein
MANFNTMEEMYELYQRKLDTEDIPGRAGTTSIFNKYSVFSLWEVSAGSEAGDYEVTRHYDAVSNRINIRDERVGMSQGGEETIQAANSLDTNSAVLPGDTFPGKRGRTPTAGEIIDWANNANGSDLYGPMPYDESDFLYCKYYGVIPNNHMVTLRRYPLPVYDNAKSTNGEPLPPIAQAVSFLGEDPGNKLSELLSMTWGIPWEEIEAEVQELEGIERGLGSGVESLAGNNVNTVAGGALAAARGDWKRWSGQLEKEVEWRRQLYTSEGPYWNQVYGPVNVIHKSNKRKRGLEFSHEFEVNFTYTLKSINLVNPKVAMLDLIQNFLALTFNNAKFWGGARRYFPNAQDPVLFFGDQSAFYNGDWDQYFSSMKNEFQSAIKEASDWFNEVWEDPKSAFEGLGNTLSNLVLGKMSKANRPHILSIRSMLSGDPVGEWHLTVGNPLKPIAVIGNLICTDVDFEVSDTLGDDDFPSEVNFKVKLKHGRPRDKGDIESMFNYGQGRMGFSPITLLPSQRDTHGEAKDSNQSKRRSVKEYDSRQAMVDDMLGGGAKNESGKSFAKQSYNRVRERIRKEWGGEFADSKNLVWVFNKTKGQF